MEVKKRGQITVFLIAAIAIMFIFGTVYFITSSVKEKKISAVRKVAVEEVPAEFEPVKRFTADCLRSSAEEGLLLLGQQGGYIDPPGEYDENDPTESDGVMLGGLKVPYWHYNSAPNSGNVVQLASLMPPLHKENSSGSVEEQLGDYVDEHVLDCLGNYSALADKGFTVEFKGVPITDAIVTKSGVIFNMNLPLEMRKGSRSADVNTFGAEFDVKLEEMYDIAKNITSLEKDRGFLERIVINFITAYSGLDYNLLPPLVAEDFSVVPKVRWVRSEVQKKIKNMLSTNIPLLRYARSSNYINVRSNNLFDQNIYNSMVIPALKDASSFDVNFNYLGWEPYVNVNNQEIITPETLRVSFLFVNLATQRYKNVYDVSFPLMVSLNDNKALSGKGFNFVFGLEANMRNNDPVFNESTKLPSFIRAFKDSMVCQKEFLGANKSMTIFDGESKRPLKDVLVLYNLPQVQSCDIGVTDDNGFLEKKTPVAYGGVLNFIKDGYLKTVVPFDSYEESNVSENVGSFELYPFKKARLSVKKSKLTKCLSRGAINTGLVNIPASSECFGSLLVSGNPVYNFSAEGYTHGYYYTGGRSDLDKNDTLVLNLNMVRGLNENFSHESVRRVAVFSGMTEEQEVELAPGIYEVEMMLLSNNPLHISKDERCVEKKLLGVKYGEDCVTFPEFSLNSTTLGGLEWKDDKTYFKITPDDLYSSSKLELYIPSPDFESIPDEENKFVMEDLNILGELKNISRIPKIRKALEPEWS